MKFQDLPDYDSWEAWKTADETWEVKFFNRFGDVILHLSEDNNAKNQIENEKFYLRVDDEPWGLKWIREREAFEMEYEDSFSTTVDADYVELSSTGHRETQHNVVHLDNNLRNGRSVALTPV